MMPATMTDTLLPSRHQALGNTIMRSDSHSTPARRGSMPMPTVTSKEPTAPTDTLPTKEGIWLSQTVRTCSSLSILFRCTWRSVRGKTGASILATPASMLKALSASIWWKVRTGRIQPKWSGMPSTPEVVRSIQRIGSSSP